MPEPADPLRRIEAIVEIIGLAHAAIFTQRRLLIDLARDDERSRALLDESVRIVFTEAPNAAREARSLAEHWAEQQLLDPHRAEITWSRLSAEIGDAQRRLMGLLARQEAIAAELRERAAGGASG